MPKGTKPVLHTVRRTGGYTHPGFVDNTHNSTCQWRDNQFLSAKPDRYDSARQEILDYAAHHGMWRK